MLPRDFSNFDSIFCCRAVPGVGGTYLLVFLKIVTRRVGVEDVEER